MIPAARLIFDKFSAMIEYSSEIITADPRSDGRNTAAAAEYWPIVGRRAL
jgi:hypothetical protein